MSSYPGYKHMCLYPDINACTHINWIGKHIGAFMGVLVLTTFSWSMCLYSNNYICLYGGVYYQMSYNCI